jgi:8-oxo-dGTP diphosphatase
MPPPTSAPVSDRPWPRCGASAAVFRGREVLLVERGKGALAGLWSLPGGHIEPGETARAAALREVAEETGVQAAIGGLVDVHDVLRHAESDGRLVAHYLLVVFWGRWVAGAPFAGGDAAKARFVALEDIGALRTTDGAPDIIRRAWTMLQAA